MIANWYTESAGLASILLKTVADWMDNRLKGDSGGETPAVDRLEERVDELVDEFRDEGPQLVAAARQVFALLGEIPVTLNWNTGLRRELNGIIEAAVQESERFGDGAGPKKRAFAIDLCIRVIRNYNLDGLPFLPPVDDVFVKPFVGILIDWSVEVLNIHHSWKPATKVRFPTLYEGAQGKWLRIGVWLWRAVLAIREVFFFPSKYERELRNALHNIDPQVRGLLKVLPPERTHAVFERLVNILVDIGKVTAPHVRLVDQILRVGLGFEELRPEERREVAFRVLRDLVRQAYAEDPLASAFITSPLGDALLRTIVNQTEWILERNGLLPDAAP